MKPYYDNSDTRIYHGDCREVVAAMDENSIDAVVTDPPYGLSFMGKGWDRGVPGVEFWEEALRVLKPGGHALVFGGTRTFHRLTCAIEDAGFEIRDCLMYLYGQGFPKSLNVSKAIDKAAGAKRKVVGQRVYADGTRGSWRKTSSDKYAQDKYTKDNSDRLKIDTAPATPEAQQWDGWGTALKPAYEPIILARKPLEGTVAANVLRWGTGALNIDGCRIECKSENDKLSATPQGKCTSHDSTSIGAKPNIGQSKSRDAFERPKQKGRWPANVILSHHPDCKQVGTRSVKGRIINRWVDGAKPFGGGAGHEYEGEKLPDDEVPVHECVGGCPIAMLDRQSGELKSGARNGKHIPNWSDGHKYRYAGNDTGNLFQSSKGGASRFFYCAKASKKERSAGLPAGEQNTHPTVKPLALMRYLCRLITPPGGTVLDPFMGSGSTGKAAGLEGFGFIGIEIDADYCEIAVQRIAADPEPEEDGAANKNLELWPTK